MIRKSLGDKAEAIKQSLLRTGLVNIKIHSTGKGSDQLDTGRRTLLKNNRLSNVHVEVSSKAEYYSIDN